MNPFHMLEAVVEHLGSAWVALAEAAGEPPYSYRKVRRQKPRLGTTEYHLVAAEEGCQRLFQTLVKLLPGVYDVSEGEVSETILRDLGEEEE